MIPIQSICSANFTELMNCAARLFESFMDDNPDFKTKGAKVRRCGMNMHAESKIMHLQKIKETSACVVGSGG